MVRFFFIDFQKCVTCLTVLVFRHFFAFGRFPMFIICYSSIIERFSTFSVVFDRVKQRDKK